MIPAIGTRFAALEDFWSDEARSQYCAGMQYTIGSEALADLVEGWIEAGKVEVVQGGAKMNGAG